MSDPFAEENSNKLDQLQRRMLDENPEMLDENPEMIIYFRVRQNLRLTYWKQLAFEAFLRHTSKHFL